MEILNYAFMQRALLAAVLVGITAPAIGIYLVQRRQALMGDGIGHVAMTGVGLGFLLSWSPVWMATRVSSSARSLS
ncbi:Metal ABC transporter permease OS=Streptomyces tendae OX=1932 GN=GUR47_09870 PE=3 SV=1 [Streptomyces tendae]